MQQNNKHLLIAGAAVIVVIALAIIIPHLKKTPAAVSGASSAVTPTDVSAATIAPQTPAASQVAFDAMIKKYEKSTVSFAADCTATPITQTVKKGTTILLVNNGTAAHTMAVGTASYTIGAHHYKTALLATSGTVSINCDDHQNVANIGVE